VYLTTYLHLVPRSKNEWSYNSTPPYAFMAWYSVKAQVGLIGPGISPTQGLYPHRTTQHSKTRINIHAPSGIRTRDPSVREVEYYMRPLGPGIYINRYYLHMIACTIHG